MLISVLLSMIYAGYAIAGTSSVDPTFSSDRSSISATSLPLSSSTDVYLTSTTMFSASPVSYNPTVCTTVIKPSCSGVQAAVSNCAVGCWDTAALLVHCAFGDFRCQCRPGNLETLMKSTNSCISQKCPTDSIAGVDAVINGVCACANVPDVTSTGACTSSSSSYYTQSQSSTSPTRSPISSAYSVLSSTSSTITQYTFSSSTSSPTLSSCLGGICWSSSSALQSSELLTKASSTSPSYSSATPASLSCDVTGSQPSTVVKPSSTFGGGGGGVEATSVPQGGSGSGSSSSLIVAVSELKSQVTSTNGGSVATTSPAGASESGGPAKTTQSAPAEATGGADRTKLGVGILGAAALMAVAL